MGIRVQIPSRRGARACGLDAELRRRSAVSNSPGDDVGGRSSNCESGRFPAVERPAKLLSVEGLFRTDTKRAFPIGKTHQRDGYAQLTGHFGAASALSAASARQRAMDR